jgi:hypothetical protein
MLANPLSMIALTKKFVLVFLPGSFNLVFLESNMKDAIL